MKKGTQPPIPIDDIYTYVSIGEDEAQFILLPENKTTIVGSDVMFKCKAVYQNGSSLPVTWSKDGNEDLPSRYVCIHTQVEVRTMCILSSFHLLIYNMNVHLY